MIDQRLLNIMLEYGDITVDDFEWAVCGRCRGEGTLGGYPGVYTQEDFAEDPDLFEDYMDHRRTCEDCGGRTTIKQLKAEVEAREDIRDAIRDWYETEAIYASERRMGA